MESNSQGLRPPSEEANEEPSKDVLKPAVLVLAGQSVVSETATATPLYQMNWSVTSIPQKDSSVVFEWVEHDQAEKVESTAPSKQQNRHLFYLAHPADAQFRTDKPAYYITSVLPEMLGKHKPRGVQIAIPETGVQSALEREEEHVSFPIIR